MSKRISMRDLAKLAGVSHTTISLALRNHSSITAELRERIQQLADEHGYRPDPLVSKVMSGLRFQKDSGHVIAYITQYETKNWQKHHVYGATFRGAMQAAEQYGYRLELIERVAQQPSFKRLGQILYARSIHGLIFTSQQDRLNHISMDLHRFSSILLGNGIVRPALHRTTTHAAHNMWLALRHLRHAGARRIGLVLPQLSDIRSEYAWSGAYSSFVKKYAPGNKIPPHTPKVVDFEGFQDWFRKYRPDAIACIEAQMPAWLRELDVACPDEVQLVDLDHHGTHAAVAGVNQNHQAVGRMAVELLLGQVFVNDVGEPPFPRTTLIDGYWVDGATCRMGNSAAAALP